MGISLFIFISRMRLESVGIFERLIIWIFFKWIVFKYLFNSFSGGGIGIGKDLKKL